MNMLSRSDLWSLEEYAEQRQRFRTQVMAHKKNRQLQLGDHARLYFEDRLTVQYQIQEMLRIEKVFEAQGINEELEAYNPLIPDGSNWKATFMLEYDDPALRATALAGLIGIENRVWLQVEDCEKTYPIADEDLERQNDEKTSSVHFLRFELDPSAVRAVHSGASISAGIDHAGYELEGFALPESIRESLAADLDSASLN
ncbi:MAG: hypothetical protein ACI9NT_001861 [Bacteroidia bacterium]|jgi:hypothetical protein